MSAMHRLSLGLCAAVWAVGCQAASSVAPVTNTPGGLALGEACDAVDLCDEQWLCLDGYCVERPWPPQPEPALTRTVDEPEVRQPLPDTQDDDGEQDTAGEHDTGEDSTDQDARLTDVDVDTEQGPEPDGPLTDAQSVDGVSSDALKGDVLSDASLVMDVEDASTEVLSAPLDAEDGGDIADGESVAPIDTSEQGGDAAVEDDAGITLPPPKKVVFLVAEDSWEQGVATPTLIPEQGQGWVTELDSPSEGSLLGIQAMMGEPFGQASCGLYRVALWFPFGGGEYNAYPSWISEQPIVITSYDEPYVWLIDDPPQVPEGPFLLGLIVDDPCEANVPRPALLSDTTDSGEGTWLYSVDSGVSALVPAQIFGVSGRWILRALIEVALE